MVRFALVLVITLSLTSTAALSAEADLDTSARIIRATIAHVRAPSNIAVGQTEIRVAGMLKRFYENRGFAPAWSGPEGPLSQIDSFVEALKNAGDDGLRPGDYPIEKIRSLTESLRAGIAKGAAPDPAATAELDLILSSTFMSFGYHLLAGRIYPEIIDGEWADYVWEADLDKLLDKAIAHNRISQTLQKLVPPHKEYYALRDALKEYREIARAGGWPTIPYGPKMKRGDRGERVGLLAVRLFITGDLASLPPDSALFGNALEQAVLRFQWRHGLVPDGIVGPRTLEALNVPVKTRIRQLEINMERWRWLPEDLGARYIFVNTAAFELEVVELGQRVMKMRIVVGKPYWHTPSFSAKMTYVVINPTWNVPRSIALDDILPIVKRNRAYLKKEDFRVLKGWGENIEAVDPDSIDWSEVNEDSFAYRLIQLPGPDNPLGRVKFMFPNRFSVYLHDTPSRRLFDRAVRTFSHGCIRIEKPLDLALYLLPGLKEEDILDIIKTGEETEISLPEPIEVHALYWTAWAADDGTVHFREDIYGRDEILLQILSEAPMTP